MWIFFIFRSSKIRISPTDFVSSLSPPWCHLSSDWCRYSTASCHASFIWSQDELVTSTSSSSNASFRRLTSQAKIEVLNPHLCHRPPSLYHLTPTFHCYKKVTSTLTTLYITQPRLHFSSSQARAPHHQSSTRRCRSLLPPSHAHRPSAQRHPRWQTSRPSFASRTTYRHLNSCKKIFEIP
jgi:hypothetical protein